MNRLLPPVLSQNLIHEEGRELWPFGAAHCDAMVVVADKILAQNVSQEASISPLHTTMGIPPKTRGGMS
jgi:hypothetical protein